MRNLLIFFALAVFLALAVGQRFVQENRVNLRECEKYAADFENYESSQRYKCYVDKIGGATREFGIAAIVHALKSYFQTPEGKTLEGPTCHVLAHGIGETAVSSGIERQDVLKECGNFCTGGCLNGAAHVYILTTQDVKDAEAFCNSATIDHEIRMTCYHGIGHGITEYTRFDIEKGLSMCDRLNDAEGKYECGHAVLMDLEPIFQGISPRIPSDMLKFCSESNEAYKDACYEFSGAIEYARSRNAQGALSACSQVSEHLKIRCTNRVVEILLYTTHRSERPERIAATCYFAEDEAVRNCFYGAVQASIFTIGAVVGEESVAICKKAPDWLQKDCYLKIAEKLFGEYGEDSKNKFCKEVIPRNYKKECEQTTGSVRDIQQND